MNEILVRKSSSPSGACGHLSGGFASITHHVESMGYGPYVCVCVCVFLVVMRASKSEGGTTADPDDLFGHFLVASAQVFTVPHDKSHLYSILPSVPPSGLH